MTMYVIYEWKSSFLDVKIFFSYSSTVSKLSAILFY